MSVEHAILTAYSDGLTLHEVAAQVGVSHMTVWRTLRRQGVQIRRQGPRSLPTGITIEYTDEHFVWVMVTPDLVNPVDSSTRGWLANTVRAIAGNRRHLVTWSDEPREIAERIVAHKLGKSGCLAQARTCRIAPVSKAEADHFYTAHHLQGKCNGDVTLGLYGASPDRLVAAMTFADASVCRGPVNTMVLQRFATDQSVPGAASRLLKAFSQQYGGPIVSYSDNRYSDGSLYRTLGFNLTAHYRPDYRYRLNGVWIAKNRCQRRHLAAKLSIPLETAPSERVMADRLGLRRHYDLGKLTWTLSNHLR